MRKSATNPSTNPDARDANAPAAMAGASSFPIPFPPFRPVQATGAGKLPPTMNVAGTCPTCQNPFTATVNAGRKRKYCGPKCFPSNQKVRPVITAANRAASNGGLKAREFVGERGINPLTSETDYDDEQREFIRAVDAWRQRTGRSFPSNTELLAIAKSLGYRKVESN